MAIRPVFGAHFFKKAGGVENNLVCLSILPDIRKAEGHYHGYAGDNASRQRFLGPRRKLPMRLIFRAAIRYAFQERLKGERIEKAFSHIDTEHVVRVRQQILGDVLSEARPNRYKRSVARDERRRGREISENR